MPTIDIKVIVVEICHVPTVISHKAAVRSIVTWVYYCHNQRVAKDPSKENGLPAGCVARTTWAVPLNCSIHIIP